MKKSPWPRDDACSRARPQSPRCQRRGSARPLPAFLPVASCPAAWGLGPQSPGPPFPRSIPEPSQQTSLTFGQVEACFFFFFQYL